MIGLMTNIVALICAGAALVGIKMMNLPAWITALLVSLVVVMFLFIVAGVFSRRKKPVTEASAAESIQGTLEPAER